MLATPSRVQILGRLKQGPVLGRRAGRGRRHGASAVSHQLRSLRHLGLVIGERRGKQVIYGLHDSHVAELLDQAIFHVQHLTLGARQPLDRPAEAVMSTSTERASTAKRHRHTQTTASTVTATG